MPIYLDNQSSTRVDPRVLDTMLPYFTEQFGNPHSASHPYGLIAAEAIDQARSEVAALIGADSREVIFTSGATEANNLAIKGAARFAREHPRGAAGSPGLSALLAPLQRRVGPSSEVIGNRTGLAPRSAT